MLLSNRFMDIRRGINVCNRSFVKCLGWWASSNRFLFRLCPSRVAVPANFGRCLVPERHFSISVVLCCPLLTRTVVRTFLTPLDGGIWTWATGVDECCTLCRVARAWLSQVNGNVYHKVNGTISNRSALPMQLRPSARQAHIKHWAHLDLHSIGYLFKWMTWHNENGLVQTQWITRHRRWLCQPRRPRRHSGSAAIRNLFRLK